MAYRYTCMEVEVFSMVDTENLYGIHIHMYERTKYSMVIGKIKDSIQIHMYGCQKKMHSIQSYTELKPPPYIIKDDHTLLLPYIY